MTLDTPLHNDPNPSILEIVATAFERPVYRAAGDGLMICIRVWYESAVGRERWGKGWQPSGGQ